MIDEERLNLAREKIARARDGCTKEQVCAILCSLCAQNGLYEQAGTFALLAEQWRSSVFKAQPKAQP
jgi:hypothetical protein